MSPEDIQKEWFRMFNESMKNNIFDKGNASAKDMDDFFKLNMLRLMDPANMGAQFTPLMPYQSMKDTFKTQMRFCIETMKVQIELMEKLLGDQDVK